MDSPTFTITPIGPFSLAEAATFGFGQRADGAWDGVMRLAFCLDGYTAQVGVEVRQDDAGVVRGTVSGPAGTDIDAVRGQVARVLSLDHDGEEFTRIGERDPVIGRLQRIAPGLRPPLFYSPYEAAAWSVLSARRPARQMMAVRQRLSEVHGAVFELAGQRVAAFPTPEALLRVATFAGIPADKLSRLHGVASAAIAGQLDSAHLLALGPDAAAAEVQQIKGIGPFYSALIVIRGTGFADVLPVAEPKALALASRLYNLDEPVSADRFAALAEPWKPLRTWAVVLIRAAGPRLLGDDPAAQATPTGSAGSAGPAGQATPAGSAGPADPGRAAPPAGRRAAWRSARSPAQRGDDRRSRQGADRVGQRSDDQPPSGQIDRAANGSALNSRAPDRQIGAAKRSGAARRRTSESAVMRGPATAQRTGPSACLAERTDIMRSGERAGCSACGAATPPPPAAPVQPNRPEPPQHPRRRRTDRPAAQDMIAPAH